MTDDRWWGTPFQPSRVLDECEAKRQIVERLAWVESLPTASWEEEGRGVEQGLGYALQCLALPYADHRDYNPDWQP